MPCYSITSSARASSVGGTARPRAFAVLRLARSDRENWKLSGNDSVSRRTRSPSLNDEGHSRQPYARSPSFTNAAST
jgi:hypothetical protein